MENDRFCIVVIAMIVIGACFITWQTQLTNRELVKAGFSYKPIQVNSYSSGWAK